MHLATFNRKNKYKEHYIARNGMSDHMTALALEPQTTEFPHLNI
jgi:hypothetical protein